VRGPPARWFASAALLLALATAQAQSFPAGGASPFRTARISEMVASAEAALMQGDAPRATELFERAASQEHASDIEVGLVRSLMQAGHYRRALAFAAHTAGAHADQTAGAALYAWLLAVGGQGAFAQRLLGEVDQRLPGDVLIQDVRQRLQPTSALPDALPLPPARFAPTGTGIHAAIATSADTPAGPAPRVPDVVSDVVPDAARVVSTGVLINQGRHVIAPSAVLGGASRMWVRNGLGRTVQARLAQHVENLGVALLKLDHPLDAAPEITLPERDAFPGTPAHAIEYARAGTDTAADTDANTAPAPAWPWLRTGFLGPVDIATGARRLGIGLPPGPRGGPVFDTSGRLVGLALAQPGQLGQWDRLLPVSALRKALQGKEPQDALGAEPARPDTPRMALDELYERALKVTLQIIAAP
jgi:Trypsin-like peptidase domain